MNRKQSLFMLTLASLLVMGGVAHAQKKTVQQILDTVDDNLLKVSDTTYNAEVSVIRDGKKIKTMTFEAVLKGLNMKRITFTGPGDVRGMAVLTTDDGLTYVYMPSYKRVRRVASHVQDQGFMGTDISAEELGTASLSKGWDAKIIKDDDKVWVLRMTPQKGTETIYSYMLVTVSKKYGGVERVESYNSQGTLVKSQVRSDWQTFGVITIPVKMVYTDHKTGSSTELRFFECKVNQGIPDSTFTTRSLMRE